MGTKFDSEKSKIVLFLFLILPIAIIIYAKIRYQDSKFILITMSLVTLVNLFIFFFTYFIVTKDKLIIKVGFFTYKSIYLRDINKIQREKTLRKGLSASWKNRIEIFYGDSSVILSPKNLEEFLVKIKA